LCLIYRTLKWVRKYRWPMRACVRHASVGPLGTWCRHGSARPLKDMIYPSSAGTLTFVRTIETCVESNFCHRTRTVHNSRSFSFVFLRMIRSCVNIIKLPNPIRKLTILKKIIILIVSKIKNKFRSHQRIGFSVICETPHVGCFQMAVTIVVLTENVCMSRR
jgi:hypothetical protein